MNHLYGYWPYNQVVCQQAYWLHFSHGLVYFPGSNPLSSSDQYPSSDFTLLLCISLITKSHSLLAYSLLVITGKNYKYNLVLLYMVNTGPTQGLNYAFILLPTQELLICSIPIGFISLQHNMRDYTNTVITKKYSCSTKAVVTTTTYQEKLVNLRYMRRSLLCGG